ncbi:MAG: lectin [Desulfovibrio sp. S3730MH75]|nr:MAG: lectin [Desulfovibrio sp. S3730MH75]
MKNKSMLFVSVLLMTLLAVPAAASNYSFGDSRYQIVTSKGISWNDAKLAAEAAGGHLATITSIEENNFLKDRIFKHKKDAYWLGAYQTGDDDKNTPTENWNWVTGEEWNFADWSSIEPNNAQINEIHLSADSRYNFQWNDEGSAVDKMIKGYVIETSTTPTPIPAAIWLLGAGVVGLAGFKRKFKK